ncbi:hypothetical protein [Marinobacter confluentis]|uniref:Glycosyltransferase RgtA/B/C/D-like domain-containing protein n=1 Tax=Marinobacter confluentis TaxID=1697557 RepID=A0A4Z1BJF2_9GAMM|nr:hypothetical protein [Marinobacter confluentis]TGN39937.1 hypothetical protein E5Q11_06465 [Marinobacter confluentis]
MPQLSSFSLAELAVPVLFIFFAGLFATWFVTRSVLLSLLLPFIKAGVFLFYYGSLFDGTWTFLDDWNYIHKGESLLGQGISITNFWSDVPALFSAAGGQHFVYYLFNADAFRLFGPEYYAPVAINIALTFVAAAFMSKAAICGLYVPQRLTTGAYTFFVLSPNLIAWSTVMNGKDTIVMTGTAMAAYAVSQSEMGNHRRALLSGLMVGLVLFFTRFYTPLLMLTALGGAILLNGNGRRYPWIWLLAISGLVVVSSTLGISRLASAFSQLQEGFVNPVYGSIRYLLTPIPFNTTEQYSFINLPQLFYWMLIPFMGYGVYRTWRRATLTSRFIVIYFLLIVMLYAIFGELQGPRHRYQLEVLIVTFQFLGILSVIKQMGFRRSGQKISRSSVVIDNSGART